MVSASRPINDFSMVYIVIGVSVSQACACGEGLVAYEDTCVSECPASYGRKTFSDGGVACVMGVNSMTTTTTSRTKTATTTEKVISAHDHMDSSSATTTSTTVSSDDSSDKVECIENAYFNGIECRC